jgi:hypothetical protein
MFLSQVNNFLLMRSISFGCLPLRNLCVSPALRLAKRRNLLTAESLRRRDGAEIFALKRYATMLTRQIRSPPCSISIATSRNFPITSMLVVECRDRGNVVNDPPPAIAIGISN